MTTLLFGLKAPKLVDQFASLGIEVNVSALVTKSWQADADAITRLLGHLLISEEEGSRARARLTVTMEQALRRAQPVEFTVKVLK